MFTRITKAGGHRYLQLVESFRNDSGKVRTRVVANLGRLGQIAPKQLDPLINGLNRAMGRAHNTSSEVIQEFGLSFGDVFMLHELWQDLGIDNVLNPSWHFCWVHHHNFWHLSENSLRFRILSITC